MSLNPSLGGIWSWRVKQNSPRNKLIVLILLWVEYGLGAVAYVTDNAKPLLS